MRWLGLLVSLLALDSTAPLAAELQFIPLQDYMAQRGVADDPAAQSYMMSRCAALYVVIAKGMDGETDPERQKVKAETYGAGEKFVGAAAALSMRGTTIEMKDAFAQTAKTVVRLSNLYVDRIEAARLRTNNMFSDTLIAGDVSTCKALLAKL